MSAGDASAGGHETILVVNDAPEVRTIAKGLLTHLGYRVLTAEDVATAVDAWDRAGGEIDLLLCDVVLRESSGALVAARLRERNPGLPVVFASGYPDDVVFETLGSEEPAVFLRKPFTLATLGAKVRDAFRRGTA